MISILIFIILSYNIYGGNVKIKCKYCNSYISDTEEKCPNCGAINEELKRVAIGVPTTIEELKKWYVEHNLPDEKVTRFFIGKDYKEPRAFGIYYDEEKDLYIVYKNKDTGERKIRYEGKDEKYAVNELYMRLKEEIANQKGLNKSKSNTNNYLFSTGLFLTHFIGVFVVMFSTMTFSIIPGLFMFLSLNPGIFIFLLISSMIKNNKLKLIIEKWWHILSFIICGILIILFVIKPVIIHRNDAYYSQDNQTYYYYGGDWYYYNYDSWEPYNGSTDSFEYISDDYNYSYGVTNFEDSNYYEGSHWTSSSNSSSSDDWDSGSSWDSSDSWDSGGSDWGSDW